MPIYEYRCDKCGEGFSVLRSVAAADKDTTCTECGSKRVKKVMSAFSCSLPSEGFGGGSFGGAAGGT